MKVLVVGSGGREHALCWAIKKSPRVERVYCAPGNGGISEVADCVAIDVMDFASLKRFVSDNSIGFVVIGPDNPLAGGLADEFDRAGIPHFGPTKAAAELEWSKGFTKDLCQAEGIPTARYQRFQDAASAQRYVREHSLPVVVKADGLALGKGVIIAETESDAVRAIDSMFEGAFGSSGQSIVIEEFLTGEEVSFFVLCDGTHVLPFGAAQDHKRVGDGDTGPNTGGMGAYSPASIFTPALQAQTMEAIIQPTVRAMAARGRPFKGVLFAGLMLTPEGPKLIEYNARFGDPECQVLMMSLGCDVFELLAAVYEGTLGDQNVSFQGGATLTVVMAAKGYPEAPKKGGVIQGLDQAKRVSGVQIFHAGTQKRADGTLIANGGRVLNITAHGRNVREARERAYEAIKLIDWSDGFCRSDIAWRELSRS